MTVAAWTDPAYEAVAHLLGSRTGLSFPVNRSGNAEAGIQRAMAKAGISDIAEYRERLQSGRLPADDLIAELTVGETYFFREPAQFEFIRKEALPEIRRLQHPDHVLRVWSAGCASGEEAYSLAILLEEEGLAGRARILGTDISRAALAKAREAVYSSWSLRGVEETRTGRYFRRQGDRFMLVDRIRERVAFEYLSLAFDAYPSFVTATWGMDLILCRNVFIYLEPDAIRNVARRLLDSLADGGWLITGPSDPLLVDELPLETVLTGAGVCYRRKARSPLFLVETQVVAPTSPSPSLPGEPSLSPQPLPQPRLEEADPLDQARRALNDGDYARVLELTRSAEAGVEVSTLRVRAVANLAGPAEAERTCSEAVARHSLSAELHYLRTVLLMELGSDEAAAQAARRVIYLDRSLAVAHFTLGSILRRLGAPAGALRAYRNARDLCAARPPDEVVPLSDGELAGRFAEAAAVQMALVEGRP
jgi:chemotaxis protein methyltransferase CheR